MLGYSRAPLFEITEFDDLCLIGVDQSLLFAPERAQLTLEPKLLLLFGSAVTLILSQLILFEQQLRMTQQFTDVVPDEFFDRLREDGSATTRLRVHAQRFFPRTHVAAIPLCPGIADHA